MGELFRLDHLATRIRRNAESLLVLSGQEPPRIWREPVTLVDVVRAATAETEDLNRVRNVWTRYQTSRLAALQEQVDASISEGSTLAVVAQRAVRQGPGRLRDDHARIPGRARRDPGAPPHGTTRRAAVTAVALAA